MTNPEPESTESKPRSATPRTDTDTDTDTDSTAPQEVSTHHEADENEEGSAPLPRWETLTAATPGPGGERGSSGSAMPPARPDTPTPHPAEPSPETAKGDGAPGAGGQSPAAAGVRPDVVAGASAPAARPEVTRDSTAPRTHAGTPPDGEPVRASHRKVLVAAAVVAAVVSAIALMTGGGGDSRTTDAKPASGTSLPGAPTSVEVPDALPTASPSTHPKSSGDTKKGHPSPDRPRGSVTASSKGATSGGGSGTDSKHSTAGGTTSRPRSDSGGGSTKSGGSGSGGSGSGTGGHNGSVTAPPPPPADNGVGIRSHASGRCIDVAGGSGAPSGSQLQIRDCDGSAGQKWTIMRDGTIRSQGMCMNVGGGSVQNGAGISRTTCNGSPAQQFVLNAAHDLVNTHADKCADVKDERTSNGTPLQIWQCGGTDNQKWSTR